MKRKNTRKIRSKHRVKKSGRFFILLLFAFGIFASNDFDEYREWIRQEYLVLTGGSEGTDAKERTSADAVTMEHLPEYSGQPYTEVNGNVPDFTDEERRRSPFEQYSDLDDLGRCGAAEAMLGEELMPADAREEIGMVRPSGWHTAKYDVIEDQYLFHRCHLIAFELTGENANEKNLITGTRYMNVEGMLPWENLVAHYIWETGDRVLYRVTPVFEGGNLVASGVHMEAESIKSREIRFNIYVYNVQPGIGIDYRTGESWREYQE